MPIKIDKNNEKTPTTSKLMNKTITKEEQDIMYHVMGRSREHMYGILEV
jgi:hypothetical protein